MQSEEFKTLKFDFEEFGRSYMGFMAVLTEMEMQGETEFKENFFHLMTFVGEMDFHHHIFRKDVMRVVERFHTGRNPHITEEFYEEKPGN